jgi:hypothetical protein
MDEAETAEMPQVCHRFAAFADGLGVQKWQWYVFTMEKLAWVYAKDKKALQARTSRWPETKFSVVDDVRINT